jgi:hypothetical protein
MEVREGNAMSSLPTIVITTDVTPLLQLLFCGKEVVVGEDLDIIEDNDRAVQGVATMHSIGEGNKEHFILKVLPTLALVDLD